MPRQSNNSFLNYPFLVIYRDCSRSPLICQFISDMTTLAASLKVNERLLARRFSFKDAPPTGVFLLFSIASFDAAVVCASGPSVLVIGNGVSSWRWKALDLFLDWWKSTGTVMSVDFQRELDGLFSVINMVPFYWAFFLWVLWMTKTFFLYITPGTMDLCLPLTRTEINKNSFNYSINFENAG